MAGRLLRPLEQAHADELLALINGVWKADAIPMALAAEEVADYIEGPHLDPARDGRVVVSRGRIIGYGLVHHRPSAERAAWAFLEGGVDPAFRRTGVGTSLIEWQLTRARERLVDAPAELPRLLRTELHPQQTSKRELFTTRGFTPVRYFEEMIRPLLDLREVTVEGFEVLPWDPNRVDEVRRVKNAAFRDHWGTTPVDEATWRHWLGEFGTRLDLSFIALGDGSVVGYSLNGYFPEEAALHGRRQGWIMSLGTLRGWRNQGVATALMHRSFQAFAREGFTHAALGVDSDNPSGAHRLYRSVGFVTDHTSMLMQRSLD